MATLTFPLTGQDTSGGLNNEIVKKEVELDFATNNASATDVVQAVKVEAGQYIVDMIVDVTTAEGATATVDIGDGDSATQYVNDHDINAAGQTKMAVAGLGKKYAAADTIDVLVNNDLDAAIVRLVVFLCKSEA